MPSSSLEHLRIVAESAAYLREEPGNVEARRRRDESVRRAARSHALSEVASNHTYNFAACLAGCRAHLAQIAARHPVVTGELGEGDCRHTYIDPYMRWADRHGVSYLGWTWDAFGGWTCESGPTLIEDYGGTPTAFGIGFREHLRELARRGG